VFRFLTGENVEAEYLEELYNRTIHDPLTGIPNRRHLLEFLERELAESVRNGRPAALVLFDIDRFKTINDTLGHPGGDSTLRKLTALLNGCIRKQDLLARYGGEEFAIVLAGTPHREASDIAERIRKEVERHPFDFEGKQYKVTISLGIASVSGQENWTADELIRQADDKLYQAKRAGRNRVIA
jgi:diguanylate cyclase (GGDEF)-like protein